MCRPTIAPAIISRRKRRSFIPAWFRKKTSFVFARRFRTRKKPPTIMRQTLRKHFPPEDQLEGFPRFDVVLLGLGANGHTASLFPCTQALHERKRWVVANPVPELDKYRLTLTFPALNAAREIYLESIIPNTVFVSLEL